MDSEFDLIARVRARAGRRSDVVLGIGDDAAILRIPPGHDLVISTDTLNVDVHFPAETAPSDIGWKALAVNLSDLAAMGAMPVWCTLNLTLPRADSEWLDRFLDGFVGLAAQHDVALVGGDTTHGPLSITVAVHGFVPHGAALHRDGAKIGDEVWISGTLGDAAAALRQWRAGQPIDTRLRARLDRPTPRIELGLALRGLASACIDVSDGLRADLDHILGASGVGAIIECDALPASPTLLAAGDADAILALQLGGGDDYELCFTVPRARAHEVIAAGASVDTKVTSIGFADAQSGLRLRGDDGIVKAAPKSGYRHFDEQPDS